MAYFGVLRAAICGINRAETQEKSGKLPLFSCVSARFSLFALPVHAQTAQPDPNVCYAIADNQGPLLNGGVGDDKDQFVKLNRFTAETTLIGSTGTTNIEAMTFVLQNEVNTLIHI